MASVVGVLCCQHDTTRAAKSGRAKTGKNTSEWCRKETLTAWDPFGTVASKYCINLDKKKEKSNKNKVVVSQNAVLQEDTLGRV